jgi:hypothetical protein
MEHLATDGARGHRLRVCKPGGLVRPQLLTKPRFPRKVDDAMAITTATSTGEYLQAPKVAPPVGASIPGAVLARRFVLALWSAGILERSINRVLRSFSRHSILYYHSLLPQTF